VASDADLDSVLQIKCESRSQIEALGQQIEHVTLEIEYSDDDCSMRANGGSAVSS
jgi:hypothetical protein